MGSGGVPQIDKEQCRFCQKSDKDRQDPAEPLCSVHGRTKAFY